MMMDVTMFDDRNLKLKKHNLKNLPWCCACHCHILVWDTDSAKGGEVPASEGVGPKAAWEEDGNISY